MIGVWTGPMTSRVHASLGNLAEAIEWSGRAVIRNPYDVEALASLRELLLKNGDAHEAASLQRQIAELEADPSQRHIPPLLTFDPPRPTLNLDTPTQEGRAVVYDHSLWSVTLSNPSSRPIEILSVKLTTAGTASSSGLGDIKSYWPFPPNDQRLAAGQALSFTKTWGFTTNTQPEQLSYVFDVCWRGDDDVKQCRSDRVDLFPN